ncbi:hypothetical protein LTS02_017590 [Friedmanniomyces endolithicus]|nr:hypothetical protein LTS02_017590 [Friedmanniomyces endolithicus]
MSDHVGFLNLMPATVPLLGTKPTSVLYVETLLRSSNKTSDYLPTILHADIATFCLIAGVAPTIYLTGSTSENFASEAVLGHSKRDTGTMSQSRFRVAWQRPWTGDPSAIAQIDITSPTIAIDPGDMARVFFQWYLQIFSEFEDTTNQLFVHFRRVVNPLSRDLGHYTRMTIVSLIGLAQKSICCDWRSFTEALIDHIQRDQTLIELCTLLHLYGMHTASMLDKTPFAAAQGFASAIACPAVSSIERYPTLPNVVAVALVIPRDSLRIFDPINIDRFGTPGLHIVLRTMLRARSLLHSVEIFSRGHAFWSTAHLRRLLDWTTTPSLHSYPDDELVSEGLESWTNAIGGPLRAIQYTEALTRELVAVERGFSRLSRLECRVDTIWSEGPEELENIALAVSHMLRQSVKLQHLVLVFRGHAGSDE